MSAEEDLARDWADRHDIGAGEDYVYEDIIQAWVAGWTAACRLAPDIIQAVKATESGGAPAPRAARALPSGPSGVRQRT